MRHFLTAGQLHPEVTGRAPLLARMPGPDSYVALVIGKDFVREERVVNGVRVASRSLDEIPEKWPTDVPGKRGDQTDAH